MKIQRLIAGACVAILWIFSGCATQLKQILPPDGRTIDGGRQVLVTVAQSEINASINQSNTTAATGGGLLFALIDVGINASRAKDAEAAIVPVRDALTDYNFDQKAQGATDKLVQAMPWLSVSHQKFNKDPSNAVFSKALDDSPMPQLLAITYDYLLTPAFDAVKVGGRVSLLSKAIPPEAEPEDRALLRNAIFTRDFVCKVPLVGATKKRAQNTTKWVENGGTLLEASLDMALAKLMTLIKKGMEFTAEQAAALNKVGGHVGKVIERDADGTLLQNNLGQWIYVYSSGPK